MGPPTHAACPRYSLPLGCLHKSSFLVVRKGGAGVMMMMMLLVWIESMHVYSVCFPAALVVRPLTGSDVS